MENHATIKNDVEQYYSDKVRTHGATPAGVDWNSEESQLLRFEQLLKIVPSFTKPFSILDYGCGYGTLFQHLQSKCDNFSFTGFDLSEAMLDSARELQGESPCCQWVSSLSETAQFDYIVASGIFNVRMEHTDEEWLAYIKSILEEFHKRASKGFSFNILTSYSDKEYMRDYLYYADPSILFDFCKRTFSKRVAILHDYPLYEFTVHVRYDEDSAL